jgi:hypothetical protein
VARDHDHLRCRVLLPDVGQRLEPIHPRHLHVEQHQVREELRVRVERGGTGLLGLHLDTLVLEDLTQRLAHAFLVVHHQNPFRHHSSHR